MFELSLPIAYVQSSTSATDLENVINEFKIAQNYFSDILNSQLIIFSIIVGALVALYFLFNWKISKEYIKSEVKEGVKETKEEIKKEFEDKNKQLAKDLKNDLIRHESEITILRGEICRQMGQFWDSEKNFSVAFIWWIRGANNFAHGGDEDMTRICLSSTKNSVEKIKYGYELNYDIIGEYQRLFAGIDDKNYKIEKDLLDKAVKDTLDKKLTT
jgi:hypothetical protein